MRTKPFKHLQLRFGILYINRIWQCCLAIASNSESNKYQRGVGGVTLDGASISSIDGSSASSHSALYTRRTFSLSGSIPSFFPICLYESPKRLFRNDSSIVKDGLSPSELKIIPLRLARNGRLFCKASHKSAQ